MTDKGGAMGRGNGAWPLFWMALLGSFAICAANAAPDKQPLSPEEIRKLSEPGEEHKRLARYAGLWQVEVRMGSGAGSPTYRGTATNRLAVGGRFLQIEYQAKGSADSTEGQFTLGFDPRHRHHTLIAMDSFGNYFVTSKGTLDAESGKLRLAGTDDDPVMKARGLTKEFVHVVDLSRPDSFAIEVWFVDTRTPARKEFKAMEYLFRRKSQALEPAKTAAT